MFCFQKGRAQMVHVYRRRREPMLRIGALAAASPWSLLAAGAAFSPRISFTSALTSMAATEGADDAPSCKEKKRKNEEKKKEKREREREVRRTKERRRKEEKEQEEETRTKEIRKRKKKKERRTMKKRHSSLTVVLGRLRRCCSSCSLRFFSSMSFLRSWKQMKKVSCCRP